jgi:hypothetical protein
MGHQSPALRAGLFRPICDRFPWAERCGKVGLLVVLVNKSVTWLAKGYEIFHLAAQGWIRINRHQVVGMQLLVATSQATSLAGVVEASMNLRSDLPRPGTN